jgi:hypothetical protein
VINVLVFLAGGLLFVTLAASQMYSLHCWYRLVKHMDSVSTDIQHQIGWPDIHHTDPGILFAVTGLCTRKVRNTYMRVMLRGLPQSRMISSNAISAAKLMRQSMLSALATVSLLSIITMRAYGFVVLIVCTLITIGWLLGDWKETDESLEAASK